MNETTINQALLYLNQNSSLWWSPRFNKASGKRLQRLRRRAAELIIEQLEKGKTITHAASYTRWKMLREAGISPTAWILIIRLVVAIAPILWDWWQSRREENLGHA